MTVCKVDGCDAVLTPRNSRGMCAKHYNRFRKYGDPTFVLVEQGSYGPVCTVDGCNGKHASKGFCQKHYIRYKKYGSPDGYDESWRNRQRWLNEHKDYQLDDCLKWPFSVSGHGRGTATLDGKSMSAPRAMCILAHGNPPTDRHHASHSCGNGHLGCMNPKHLSWKTPKQNERDKIKHGTLRRGEAINTCKLTEAQVLEIREKLKFMRGVDIAKEYNVSPTVVSNINVGKSWGWL